MHHSSPTRRDFLRQAATLAIGASALTQLQTAAADVAPFPFSSGMDTPSFRLPANACDCHMHIYDSRFPAAPGAKLRPPTPPWTCTVCCSGGSAQRATSW